MLRTICFQTVITRYSITENLKNHFLLLNTNSNDTPHSILWSNTMVPQPWEPRGSTAPHIFWSKICAHINEKILDLKNYYFFIKFIVCKIFERKMRREGKEAPRASIFKYFRDRAKPIDRNQYSNCLITWILSGIKFALT